jgi:hypothetical protein
MTTTQRGYGHAHRQRRAALLAAAYGQRCPLCGERMQQGQPLDLDHSVPLIDNPSSTGDRITHAACNRGRGGAGRSLENSQPARDPATFRARQAEIWKSRT